MPTALKPVTEMFPTEDRLTVLPGVNTELTTIPAAWSPVTVMFPTDRTTTRAAAAPL